MDAVDKNKVVPEKSQFQWSIIGSDMPSALGLVYNRGGVLSDQFDHFKLILFWVPECSFCKK